MQSHAWIVKPAASAQGRGIYVTSFRTTQSDTFSRDTSEVSLRDAVVSSDTNAVVCRYVTNPLLLNGCKFDLRLYVAVTSMNPLRIYLHEVSSGVPVAVVAVAAQAHAHSHCCAVLCQEGLCRFATEPYNPDPKYFSNRFMHLTNYSINKKSAKFVSGDDAEGACVGHKWTLTALKQRSVWRTVAAPFCDCVL